MDPKLQAGRTPSQGFDREMYGEEGDADEKSHQDAGELRLFPDEKHPPRQCQLAAHLKRLPPEGGGCIITVQESR
eukprot:3550050-Prymnesium_polylepis.1